MTMRCLCAAALVVSVAGFFAPEARWTQVARRSATRGLLQAVPEEAAACPVEELPNPEIRWMPLSALKPAPEVQPDSENATVYPLFPLGSVVYLPETQHILNIFEPRYRKMYNDILLSGSRSFAVVMQNEFGQLAECASLFYLEDLKEVSEQTKDQVGFPVGRIPLLGSPLASRRPPPAGPAATPPWRGLTGATAAAGDPRFPCAAAFASR